DYIEIANDDNADVIPYFISIGQNPGASLFQSINTNSAFEFTQTGFICNFNTGISVAQGNLAPDLTIQIKPDYFYPISLSRNGTNRNFGMLTIFGAQSLRCSVVFKEYR
ncbi:MAG: hypothetical protein WD512_17515, partial [Candidatus Paceibacterota bacterium]